MRAGYTLMAEVYTTDLMYLFCNFEVEFNISLTIYSEVFSASQNPHRLFEKKDELAEVSPPPKSHQQPPLGPHTLSVKFHRRIYRMLAVNRVAVRLTMNTISFFGSF